MMSSPICMLLFLSIYIFGIEFYSWVRAQTFIYPKILSVFPSSIFWVFTVLPSLWIEMSSYIDGTSEKLCYIPCKFCNILLAVSVPCSSLMDTVTVRCGHCTNMWPVNMAASAAAFHSQSSSSCQDLQLQAANYTSPYDYHSSKLPTHLSSTNVEEERIVNRPPEKKQRVPSAYNQFIKEEIQRIKTNNPDISHREAFSSAAKNWAHFPRTHFGLMLETNNNRSK